MTARAFIIAIEDYSNSQGMASQLPGTNKGAEEFYRWLVEDKKLDKSNIVGCVDQAFDWRTTGTTRDEILAALETLVSNGRDDTSELYFFFSGHGFSYTDMGWTRAIDVLVASDFISQPKSGGSCIKLQEIQEKLWSAMGPGDHYYFIDACRNTTTHAKINVLDTGLIFTASELGKPYRYTLYSTVKGRVAGVESGFVDALVQGLKGAGRAKGWQEDNSRMYVKFDLLVDYVERKLPTQAVDPATDGNGKGLILELIPTPESECVVKIDHAGPDDKFKLIAKTTFGKQGPFEFQGDTYSFKLLPYLYNVEISNPNYMVVQVNPPPPAQLDLYDRCEVHFELSSGRSPHVPPPSTLTLSLPGMAESELEVEVENLHTGKVVRSRKPFGRKVEPGTYQLKMRERGAVVGRQKVTVKPGEEISVDLLKRPKSKIKETILKAVSNDPKAQVAVFSEKHLGSTANWDLGLWLSIFGASRIIGSEIKHEFKKLEKLALASFNDIGKDESCVYILAGFEKSKGEFGVGLSEGEKVDWESLIAVKGLTSIYQWRAKTMPGSYLLSLQLPAQVPSTFAIYCLQNRATFVVFAEDKLGRLSVRQYMLPISHLIQHLDETVRAKLAKNPLSLVRYMFLAQSQFARKRSLEPDKESEERETWEKLTMGKWLDPVMSLIAAYYFIRQGTAGADTQGKSKESERNSLLDIVIGNLRKYFGAVPDVEAIAKLIKHQWKLPSAPPLLLDGVLAFSESEGKSLLPLPAHLLDYSGPWTAWRGAVNAFTSSTRGAAKNKRSGTARRPRSPGKVASKKAVSKAVRGHGAAAKKSTKQSAGKKRG